MKKTISRLTEQVVLLQERDLSPPGKAIETLSIERYAEIMPARAAVLPTKSDNSGNHFDVIILKPPAQLRRIPIAAIRWQNKDYPCISHFTEYKSQFLKGRIRG